MGSQMSLNFHGLITQANNTIMYPCSSWFENEPWQTYLGTFETQTGVRNCSLCEIQSYFCLFVYLFGAHPSMLRGYTWQTGDYLEWLESNAGLCNIQSKCPHCYAIAPATTVLIFYPGSPSPFKEQCYKVSLFG